MRPYPFLGIGLGRLRHRQADWSRTSSGCSSTTARAGFLEAKARVDAATSPAALGELGAVAAAAETVSREAHDLYVRFSIVEGPRVMLATEDFASTDGTPLPYDRNFLLQSVALRPGAPTRPPIVQADGKRLVRLFGDTGFGLAAVEPDVDRARRRASALTWKVTLGPRMQVGPDLRARQLRHARPDDPASRSGCGRATR